MLVLEVVRHLCACAKQHHDIILLWFKNVLL